MRGLAEWRALTSDEPASCVPTGSLSWDETGVLADRLERLRTWGHPVEELTAARPAELEPALRVPGVAHAVILRPGCPIISAACAPCADPAATHRDGSRSAAMPDGAATLRIPAPG